MKSILGAGYRSRPRMSAHQRALWVMVTLQDGKRLNGTVPNDLSRFSPERFTLEMPRGVLLVEKPVSLEVLAVIGQRKVDLGPDLPEKNFVRLKSGEVEYRPHDFSLAASDSKARARSAR
jgi:hypothetical protein